MCLGLGLGLLLPPAVWGQIDPVQRDLIQFGYNQPVEGREPIAAYAYYYHNDPDFIRTNLTLRLAIAPTYLDSELDSAHLGPQTDVGLGLAGGGFADNYNEIRNGKWIQGESFDGYGGELSGSIYHLFNPGQLIPLNLVARGGRIIRCMRATKPPPIFNCPTTARNSAFRTGLRYGGIEPTLFPDLAMELAVWYEGQFRTDSGGYGFDNDRANRAGLASVLGLAALSYTWPESKQNLFVPRRGRHQRGCRPPERLPAGRLSAAGRRISPVVAGILLSRNSARGDFALINASYLLPIAPNERWNLEFNGATAGIDYLPAPARRQLGQRRWRGHHVPVAFGQIQSPLLLRLRDRRHTFLGPRRQQRQYPDPSGLGPDQEFQILGGRAGSLAGLELAVRPLTRDPGPLTTDLGRSATVSGDQSQPRGQPEGRSSGSSPMNADRCCGWLSAAVRRRYRPGPAAKRVCFERARPQNQSFL